MLSLFRTNQLIVNVLLIFYSALCRFSPLVTGAEIGQDNPGVLASYLYSFTEVSPGLSCTLSILLVFLHAVLINIMVANHRMANEISLLPGFFYILFCSSIPEFLVLSPPLLANTFYIIALFQIFNAYKNYSATGIIFNTGFWLAVGSLFYFSAIAYIVLAFIALGTVRASRFKENLVLLVGFIVPYFLINVVYFWNDELSLFWSRQFTESFGFLDLAVRPVNIELQIKLGFFLLLILIVMLNAGNYRIKKIIQVQKYISIFYWGMLITGLATLIQSGASLQHLLLLGPSLGVFLSFSFQKMSRSMSESLHLLLLIGILLLQFKPLWMSG